MALAFYWKSIVDVATVLEQIPELSPHRFPLARLEKGLGISNNDQAVPSSGQEDIQSFRRSHEANIVLRITSRQRSDHNLIIENEHDAFIEPIESKKLTSLSSPW